MNNNKSLFSEWKILLRSVPSLTVALFGAATISMNLLANKSINLPFSWLALDCGFIVSWMVFLCMDIVTKRFGAKAATLISVTGIGVNLVCCRIFYIGSKIGGMWGESYIEGSEALINTALDNTFGGTWYVLLGSTIAMFVSAVVNNYSNQALGKAFEKNPDSFAAYACRTYVSTAIGQFVDNLLFAFIVSHHFFGWTTVQCITCAITGAVAELLCEVVFSPVGYRISNNWKKEKVGEEYLRYIGAME